MENICILEVRGPSGPQLLVDGPLGRLDFVLRAPRALRPCDPKSGCFDTSGSPVTLLVPKIRPKIQKSRNLILFTRHLLPEGSSLLEEILSVCGSVGLWICLSVITFSFFEYSMI